LVVAPKRSEFQSLQKSHEINENSINYISTFKGWFALASIIAKPRVYLCAVFSLVLLCAALQGCFAVPV
jgi:hypothetical protein